MARFEHRFAALTLQDENGVWAQFSPDERMVDGREKRFGVLETDDPDLIDRLRDTAKRDPDLVEVAAASPAAAPDPDQVPTGSAGDVLAWVEGDKDRAAKALEAEQSKGDRARTTLVAALTKLIEA